MNYFKHWKIELILVLISAVAIPLSSHLFSLFVTEVLIVPLVSLLLPLLLYKKYKLLLLYPLGISFIYSLYLIRLSSLTGSMDLGLITLASLSILMPTIIGYIISSIIHLFIKPTHYNIMSIHCLSILLLAISLILSYGYHGTTRYALFFYLIMPIVILSTQALIISLHTNHIINSFVPIVAFTLLHLYIHGKFSLLFTCFYLSLSLLIRIFITIKNQH